MFGNYHQFFLITLNFLAYSEYPICLDLNDEYLPIRPSASRSLILLNWCFKSQVAAAIPAGPVPIMTIETFFSASDDPYIIKENKISTIYLKVHIFLLVQTISHF